ncbi:hypothetical protein AAC387_Pa05g1077 [Persea americana]
MPRVLPKKTPNGCLVWERDAWECGVIDRECWAKVKSRDSVGTRAARGNRVGTKSGKRKGRKEKEAKDEERRRRRRRRRGCGCRFGFPVSTMGRQRPGPQ